MKLRDESIPPPTRLKQLEMQNEEPSPDYTALVDGLLWSSYPETVSILSNHQREKEFAKVNHWSLLGSTYYMLINLVNVIGFYDHAADY